MKKAMKTIIPIFIVLAIVVSVVFTQFIKFVNLEQAQSITLNYKYGEKNIHVEITDKNDLGTLKSICKGTAINDFSIPSCGFGTAELVFKENGKITTIYPACDSCDTMRLSKEDKFFYSIGEANREKLVEILKKYGATFPCV